jgi:hypothetical protein
MTTKRIIHHDSSRHSSTTGFLDLLFNILLGFVLMFIILLAIMKVETAKPGVEDKNKLIITITWDSGSQDDVDTWVRDPFGNIISYRQRETGTMYLQRDDLGQRNDRLTTPTGEQVGSDLNQEVVNIRHLLQGEYVVNLHLYGRGAVPADGPAHVTVQLIRVEPYKVIATSSLELAERGQEATAISFEVFENGEITTDSVTSKPFIYSSALFNSSNSGGAHP